MDVCDCLASILQMSHEVTLLHKIKLEENKSVFLQWFLDVISSVYSFGVFLLLLALGLPVPFFFPL